MKVRLLLSLLIACASILLASFFYDYFAYEPSIRILPAQPSETPMVFQPDAQTLSKAIDPLGASPAPGESAAASADSPVTASPNAVPYAYATGVCRAKGTDNPFQCLSSYYRGLVRDYGSDTAFADIKRRYSDDPLVAAECHPLMHGIGQEASRSYATVSEAYLHGDSFCWSGYYHGILEGVIARIGLENLPGKLDTICADIPGKRTYSFDYYNCVHGLGHGIMEALDDEVPASLEMCDRLTGDWERQSCYSGVFMENIISNEKIFPGHTPKYLKPTEPLFPCGAIDDKYRPQCYLGQTSYALEVSHYDFAGVSALCAAVEQPFRDICFQSYGRDAANQAMHDALKTKDTCSIPADSGDRRNCAVGAAKEFVSYYHSDAQAKTFCDALDAEARQTCRSVTDAYYKLF